MRNHALQMVISGPKKLTEIVKMLIQDMMVVVVLLLFISSFSSTFRKGIFHYNSG